ncbi:hypothetical protein OQJ02_00145 [Legionella sp. PATHC032]|uniref:hypothetical protein n=1 Tax=Legionella sp. PATHC032 TaxID=2992039 RepID=UPI001B07A248|nr:hypothetical protein [Legionella sp. PATHC032]MCW8420046.1 hypothetical protein [Legionella sp. PATHC032]HAZ7574297.1 hypothetical protein [Legionella pneumophila]HBA1635421.1 hypothetical protein [Legionella pneumophila]
MRIVVRFCGKTRVRSALSTSPINLSRKLDVRMDALNKVLKLYVNLISGQFEVISQLNFIRLFNIGACDL